MMNLGAGKGLLLSDKLNVRYFTRREEFRPSFVLLTDRKIIYLTQGGPPVELPSADGRETETITISRENTASEILRLYEREELTALIAEETIPAFLHEELEEAIGITLVENPLGETREIKTPWELEQLAKASKITDEAFEAILGVLKPGISELEVAARLEYEMRIRGSEESNKTIVAAGPGGASPHHWPTGYRLQKGDFVTMDYGCTVNGYHSDLTRTVILGEPSRKQLEIYQLVLAAQEAGEAALKAGVNGNEVDAVARAVIEKGGYGEYFVHNLGHGIGLDIHEGTGLTRQPSGILKENMVVSVEPGIYIEGFGGVRIENILRVGSDKSETLEKSDKQLIIL